MENNKGHPNIITRWIKISTNIDLDTGEIISNKERDKNYTIIKKIKKPNEYQNNTGIINYDIWCRRKPKQGELY